MWEVEYNDGRYLRVIWGVGDAWDDLECGSAPCSTHQPQLSALDRREQQQQQSTAELLHNAALLLWLTRANLGGGYSQQICLYRLFPLQPNPHHISTLQRAQEVSVGIGFYSDLDRTR